MWNLQELHRCHQELLKAKAYSCGSSSGPVEEVASYTRVRQSCPCLVCRFCLVVGMMMNRVGRMRSRGDIATYDCRSGGGVLAATLARALRPGSCRLCLAAS
jgi:hypothetical protein